MNKTERIVILESLDYNLSTRVLSEQSGIEKRHITEYRKKHGKGRATVYTPHCKPRKMLLDPNSIDWSKSITEIVAEAGVSRQRIYQLRKRVVDAAITAAEAMLRAERGCRVALADDSVEGGAA